MQNKKFFIITSIYYFSLLAVSLIFLLSHLGVLTNKYLSTLLIQLLVMTAIPLILYSLFVTKNAKQTFSHFGFKKTNYKILLWAIVLGIIMYVLNIFVSSIFQNIIQFFGYDGIIATDAAVTKSFLSDVLLIAILPAVCEEILHRGLMVSALKKVANPKIAILISALFFGLIHLNINQFFYAAILGAMLAFVTYVSNSIFPAMIMHFLNNFLSIFFSYGTQYNWPLANLKNILMNFISSANYMTLFLIIFLLIIFLVYAFFAICSHIARLSMQSHAENIVNKLNIDKLEPAQAQEKIILIDSILKKSANNIFSTNTDKIKLNFTDKIFVFSSIFLGGMLTIISFIWGIL